MDMMDGTLARTLAAFKPGIDLRVARLILAPAQALAGSRAVVTRALAGL